MTFKYDEDHPHCRECECPICIYFYKNDGYCDDACQECDGESHVKNCPMSEGVEE